MLAQSFHTLLRRLQVEVVVLRLAEMRTSGNGPEDGKRRVIIDLEVKGKAAAAIEMGHGDDDDVGRIRALEEWVLNAVRCISLMWAFAVVTTKMEEHHATQQQPTRLCHLPVGRRDGSDLG
jgi:hypothetical protein